MCRLWLSPLAMDSNTTSIRLESIPERLLCLILTVGLNIPKVRSRSAIAFSIALMTLSGCVPTLNGTGLPQPDLAASNFRNDRSFEIAYQGSADKKTSSVLAQGRLQPARGIIRISALPGDRIDEIAVKPGQSIAKGATIAKLQSHAMKSLELEGALLKLEEAKSLLEAKQKEAELQVDAAKLKQQLAQIQLVQAKAQRQQANQSQAQVASLANQINILENLRNDPLTRAAVGTIELETRRNELQRMTSLQEQALLASNQAVELGELQVEQAERLLMSASEGVLLVEKSSPIASLTKQIEILKEQLQQLLLASPIDGFVINVNAEPGERVGPLPIVELADLTNMVCVAEVHEADVGKLSKGNRVELRSASLDRTLSGVVERIDRVVGSVQMRSPNPMARSDFRAVSVWIAIDSKDAELASNRLQLQVDVAIFPVQ